MPVIGKENAPNRLRNFKNMGKEDVSRKFRFCTVQNMSTLNFFVLELCLNGIIFCRSLPTEMVFLSLGVQKKTK